MEIYMDIANYTLNVPIDDQNLLETLIKKIGYIVKNKK